MLKPMNSRRQGRGFSLLGILFWSISISMVAVFAMRVFPTVNEYFTIVKAINSIAKTAKSADEVKTMFDKQTDIEYSISSIKPSDLIIVTEKDKLVIKFAYEKEIDLFGPVYLLIKYEGRSV